MGEEKIIETQGELSGKDKREYPGVKGCELCSLEFDITDKDLEFYSSISPVFGDKKYEIPSPKLCPSCREQRRLSFINERKLYRRESSKTGKNIISVYSPDKDLNVIEQVEWWGNSYDGLDYQIKIDIEGNFFNQYIELFKKVPKSALSNINCQNSEYNNYLIDSKNSYLCIGSNNIEDSSYVSASNDIKKSFDVWWSEFIENSYEIFNSSSLYKSYYSQGCLKSNNLIFCKDLVNCSDCIFCYGLRGKKYHIMNKEYSREDYEEELKDLDFFNYSRLSEYYRIFNNFVMSKPQKYMNSDNSQNVTGDYVYDSINCKNTFNVVGLKDSSYVYEGGKTSNLFDCTQVYEGEGKILDSVMIFRCFKVLFSVDITDSNNIYYCSNLINCNNCFLCSGLRNKKYCILNKEYTEEEYNKLVPKIIENMQYANEWGEFFALNISPFGYNETIAHDYFSLNKDNATKVGFNWSDYESPVPEVKKIIAASKLPENITDIPDDILNWAIECVITKKPFRIVKQELDFYRKHNLPIPRKHPDERHLDRMTLRNERKLYNRNCDMCNVEIKSTFSPEGEEIIYCEDCYNKEIY